ncbi:MAG: hypothetical protein P1S60_11060, partial [Anaerolineae bacterium]|nr:hypothetical protein [Anaerolineae bacterium]
HKWMGWLGVLIGLGVLLYSHVLAPLILPVLFLWLVLSPGVKPATWVAVGVGAILVIALYSPVLLWQVPMVFTPRQTGFPEVSLAQMVTALLTGWTNGITMGAWTGTTLSAAITVFICLLACAGLFSLLELHRRRAIQLVIWLCGPLIGLWLINLISPMFTDRYLIWTAPVFYILVATGVSYVWKIHEKLGFGLAVCLVLCAVPANYVQATEAIKPRFEQAARHILDRSSKDDLWLFHIPYNARVVQYYTQNLVYPWAEAPYTNWRTEDGGFLVEESYVDQEMAAIVAGYQRVWLVYSEIDLWDSRELVKQWLNARWVLADRVDFHGVTVYEYKRLH